ncbi:MAG: YccF domain-containing protein [Firmicutes bacterium]|nr:YccF domain-containing protein [Bacillota bacterium]MCL2771082.1 YccF domain-containing protein [Bacillota bacterium]
MNAFGNVLWFICGGVVAFLLWLVAGLVFCVTIVGIPFGLQAFKLAKLSLAPFSRKIWMDPAKHPVANAAWAVLVGWALALVTALAGVILCITIIGLPFGKQLFKFAQVALFPFGSEVN